MEELAAREADRLAELLDLEDWQVFYVDSTLQHDYAALEAEIKTLRDSKVENPDLYVVVQDKWMDKIFNSFKTFSMRISGRSILRAGQDVPRRLAPRGARRQEESRLFFVNQDNSYLFWLSLQFENNFDDEGTD